MESVQTYFAFIFQANLLKQCNMQYNTITVKYHDNTYDYTWNTYLGVILPIIYSLIGSDIPAAGRWKTYINRILVPE